PYILSDEYKMGRSFYMENKEHEIDTYYYNPYKNGGDAKIIYNVTVDESSLKGLTADEAYRIQKERLARERKEKKEKEAEELRQFREKREAYLREWKLKKNSEETHQSADPTISVPN
ncbi:hypothetical protein, partial [Aeromonas simiae]|uniref:hypothetical protein n=1 Tax=Aeromonas simiae TaxID=218936 RepID=UPI00266B6E9B